MKKITRTIKTTKVSFTTAVDGKLIEQEVVLPFAAKTTVEMRKAMDAKYPYGVIINSWEVEENKYEMSVETFMSNATLVTDENKNEDEEEEN